MNPQPQLTIFGPRGDITVTWDPTDPQDEAEMLAYIEQRLAAGYLFFAVEGDTQRKIKHATDARGVGSVRQVKLETGDKALDALADKGVVKVARAPVSDSSQSLGALMRDPAQIVRRTTVTVAPISGG